QVQALWLALARRAVGVRQPARHGGGVADGRAIALAQPHRVVGMRQDHALLFGRVGVGEEGLQVFGRIQVAKGLDEGAGGQRREGVDVVGRGAADGGGSWHGTNCRSGGSRELLFFVHRKARGFRRSCNKAAVSPPPSAAAPHALPPTACPGSATARRSSGTARRWSWGRRSRRGSIRCRPSARRCGRCRGPCRRAAARRSAARRAGSRTWPRPPPRRCPASRTPRSASTNGG